MTDEELRKIVANLAISQAKTDEQLKKTGEQLKKTDEQLMETEVLMKEQMKKTDEQMKKTDEQIKRLGKQIGGLGAKFGGFTEGMAFPSMKKILEERFDMSVISTNVRSRRNGRAMELDVLAYSNTDVNEVYVVEVKSHLREEGLDQILRDLNSFFEFFPGHRGKKLYGIIAAVDSPENLEHKVINMGIYLAKIRDETFDIQVPEGFIPKSYGV